MNLQSSSPGRQLVIWSSLAIAVVALIAATAALTVSLVQATGRGSGMTGGGSGMMGGGSGMMGGGSGMMGGGSGMMGRRPAGPTGSLPGSPGFVPGTAAAPRVVRVWAGPGDTFNPDAITVARGETVTFQVTVMGPVAHEFMVGPAADVAADVEGTPEIDSLAMMQTRSITYTFDGLGPYAFACHEPGHDEAGMHGTITLVG